MTTGHSESLQDRRLVALRHRSGAGKRGFCEVHACCAGLLLGLVASAALCLSQAVPKASAQSSSESMNLATLPISAKCVHRLLHAHAGAYSTGYTPGNGTIAMSNDGGWCWAMMSGRSNNSPYVPPVSLTTPPTHGRVRIDRVGVRVRIAYQPEAGFLGSDSFEVYAQYPRTGFPIPFHVTVSQ